MISVQNLLFSGVVVAWRMLKRLDSHDWQCRNCAEPGWGRNSYEDYMFLLASVPVTTVMAPLSRALRSMRNLRSLTEVCQHQDRTNLRPV